MGTRVYCEADDNSCREETCAEQSTDVIVDSVRRAGGHDGGDGIFSTVFREESYPLAKAINVTAPTASLRLRETVRYSIEGAKKCSTRYEMYMG